MKTSPLSVRTGRLALYILFVMAVILPLSSASAQGRTPTDDEVNRIARELYCPVCENTPLDVCPTQACAEWREQIRRMLAEGKTDEEIKQYFVEYYGARVLAEPPRQGFNWLAYLVPPLIILLGIFVLVNGFREWKKPVAAEAGAGSVEPPEDADGYIRQIEEELQRRK